MANSPSTSPTSTSGVSTSDSSSTTPLSVVASTNGASPPPSTSVSSPSTSISSPSTSSTSSQINTSSTSTPTSTTVPTTISSSSSHSSQQLAKTPVSHSPTSSSSTHTTPTSSSNSSHRLANGAVAGIVVGVALGIALLTFLATFFLMRRQQQSKEKQRYRSSKDRGGFELKQPRQQDPTPVPKKALVAEASGVPGTYESFLPQSADDSTIQQQTKAILDQIELHVENFYRNSASSTLRSDNAELAVFDSPFLPAPLASLLPRSKNKINIIKHALAQSVISSISPSASPARSLLPTEYGLLPNTLTSARASVSTKAGTSQIMSRWRVMTAYLRPDPIKDTSYIAQRDTKINDTVQSFAKAFAPWKSTGYKDEERARSLSAILGDAATLGIFLFSQPSTLQFLWPASNRVGQGKIVVSPALVKTTDEKGQDLVEAQVMVDNVVLDA